MRHELIRKRRQLALDYWRQIPPERVMLTSWIEPEARIEQHLFAYGLEALKCRSVGCLAGWLLTMPEVIDDYHRTSDGPGTLSTRLAHLCAWLQLPEDHELFATRDYHDPSESDHAIALHRLETLQRESRP